MNLTQVRDRETAAGTHAGEGRSTQREWRLVVGVVLLALVVRLIFLYIAPNGSTDAGARYRGALAWLSNPFRLPLATATDAWLPLHFWLLGAWLWVWKSETGARLLSVFLGTLTLLPYWGIVKRAFDRRVALVSALLLALFGFHIAFSVTTGSEAPTIFFLALGTYGWMRSPESWKWIIVSAAAFSAASLIRFESWLFMPVLGVMTLDFSAGWQSLRRNRLAWRRACGFTLLASAGAIAWLIFSSFKWGDPLELPHRTIALGLYFAPIVLRHSLPFRALVVPGSLLISLSPLVAGLAAWGVLAVAVRGSWKARSLAALATALFVFGCFNAVRYDITQARYTVVYSWLLIPFAFEGLRRISARWKWAAAKSAVLGVLAFFLIWQAAIIVGAQDAPAPIADHLGAISPALPLHREMRDLTAWLRKHVSPTEPLVIDDFNWESDTIVKSSGLDSSRDFLLTPAYYASPPLLASRLKEFVTEHRPAHVVCSPYGPIGSRWSVGDKVSLEVPSLGIELRREWRGKYWSVYAATYGF